jgi:hypothetical protein
MVRETENSTINHYKKIHRKQKTHSFISIETREDDDVKSLSVRTTLAGLFTIQPMSFVDFVHCGV